MGAPPARYRRYDRTGGAPILRPAMQILAALTLGLPLAQALPPIPEIARRIPPPGKALTEGQAREVELALAHLAERMVQEPRRTDIPTVHKAVRFALENGEFYDPSKDLEKISDLVSVCDAPFAGRKTGVRGYRSSIDGSWQPYAVVVPEGLDLSEPVPLWIWLHGRGDKETDLHFLHKRLKPTGPFQPEDAVVLHPFGRQCIGWKHAGERDVFEAMGHLREEIEFDPDRVALCGFSMGGAGAWHIGAHYPDVFAVVHAGAGFAETARYTKLKEEDFPPSWEQILWGVYDVPNYARNLLNSPVIAYSGENDKQIQAARVMEEALAAHGHELQHVIGAGMGHKYDPDSVREIEAFVRNALASPPRSVPDVQHLQTRTLRYATARGIRITGLEKHWEDSRLDIVRDGDAITLSTENVLGFEFVSTNGAERVTVDGQQLNAVPDHGNIFVERKDGAWVVSEGLSDLGRKRPGLQGPIDDAFMASFLVAIPDKEPASELHARWVEFEIARFERRWRELFRGEVRTKPESELTVADHLNHNIIAWGTAGSSPLVESVMGGAPDHDPATQIVAMVRPNPANREKYLVINSGPTFREAHDRTNSLQNPKLGDWAVIDLRRPPDAGAPGEVVASGFFDERWE